MDSITSSALEEICSSGPNGLTLLHLWTRLCTALTASSLDLCYGVKQAVWSNLLNVQGLRFRLPDNSDANSSHLSVEAAEEMKVNIVAEDHLRECFLGMYDVKAREGFKGLSSRQRQALERLAIARSNGITQNELAKELGIVGNEIFYVLKSLECQGLIVRQSTVVWRKGRMSNEDNPAAIATNMLYLHRYAKHLGTHQRLEITKEDELFATNGDIEGESFKDNVCVKDFLPALKAICNKLEEANEKVLVVRDIKQDLGYRHQAGHRAWRNICQKLKDDNVVEEIVAKVNNKVVPCLRLLKEFTPKGFEDEADSEQIINAGERGLVTEQVLELPIEHQIYDMIDAEGSKGLTVIEVCRRLGISNKKYYNRLISMFSRLEMHVKLESYKKGTVYRVWTPGNFNSDQSNAEVLAFLEDLTPSTNKDDVSTYEEMKNKENKPECSRTSQGVGECADVVLDLVNEVTPLDAVTSSTSPPVLLKPLKPQLYKRYPCPTITEVSAHREQRVLEKLQEEKFLVRSELQGWLESFEKDTSTTMDIKTLIRILNRLEQQGQCKCIKVSVPVITNCGRTRIKDVVLHPSVQNLPSGLLAQIHDKLRSLEMQSRGHGISRLKDGLSAPVLNIIEKTPRNNNNIVNINNNNSVVSDGQPCKSEAMHTNGYVLARMVRAKLLHRFLWNHLSCLPEWGDAISSGENGYDMNNPHSICKPFSLDNAVKEIPLELFLQVVGSTKTFDNLVEKCKSGLRLSDLPVHEYKSLMDTSATARLSCTIDILRRLKLIRVVSDGNSEVQGKYFHVTCKHAMELKPYIEEPRTVFSPSSDYTGLDLRPQIRHDFILLKKDAVDDYWTTLEYCYSAADHVSALHAFPGSSVHEVFLFRSWASVRVMSAEQRAELLQRVVKEDPNKTLSMKECDKIAKDLHLTLQQVLRVYYYKRQERLSRLQGDLDTNRSRVAKRKRKSSSSKSKSSLKKTLSYKSDALGEQENCISAYMNHENTENMAKKGLSDDEHENWLSNRGTCSGLKPTMHQNKFSWSENSDRQLVMQYIRHRARLGANYHRTDWGSVPNLPGPPTPCKRRIATLKRDIKFRKSIMELCNLFGERYAKYMEKIGDSDFKEQWDNFDDESIKLALDDAFLQRKVDKFQSSSKDGLLNQDSYESELVSSTTHTEKIENDIDIQRREYGPRSNSHHLPRKFIKQLSEGRSNSKRTYTTLAVSNAVELFKLAFLNSSTAVEIPNLLSETRRRYSDHDLFAAYSYLTEKGFMVGGTSGNSYALSDKFWKNINSSPFPPNTGEGAAEFSNWLQENTDCMEEGIDLNDILQCGDIIYLFSLVSLGELSISPCLPEEGIGDVEDLKTLKRKAEKISIDYFKSKKLKSSFLRKETEMISRREKGFPGLRVSLSCGDVKTGTNVADLLQDETFCNEAEPSCHNNYQSVDKDINYCISIAPGTVSEDSEESLWEAMKNYAQHLIIGNFDLEQLKPICPEIFRTVCTSIQEAGDQGLSMDQISKVMNLQDGVSREKLAQLIVEVLVTFGQALKVNAYNSVHVVDALYRSKYFLTSNQELNNPPISLKSCKRNDSSTSIRETHTNYDKNVHQVTVLNFTEVFSLSSIGSNPNNGLEANMHNMGNKYKACETSLGKAHSFIPIVPWVNGDGTINKVVYNSLVRRVLGIVMDNPGILEDDVAQKMDVVNPQNCRKLMELMVLDKHLIVRKMHQTVSGGGPPTILGTLFTKNLKASKSIYRDHFFANPLSTSLL